MISTNSQNGYALIAVFWLIAILSLAVLGAMNMVERHFDFLLSQRKMQRLDQLAEMGIALGAHPKVEQGDPLLVNVRNEEGYRVTLSSEEAKLSINALLIEEDIEVLENLFNHWGLGDQETALVIDSLLDWTDGNENERLNGAERNFYVARGESNHPLNRPFYSLDEMALVRGMDLVAEKKPEWRDSFSIWSQGKLNVNRAPAELIMAASGSTFTTAQQIVSLRNGPDEISGTKDDKEVKNIDELLQLLGILPENEFASAIEKRFTTEDNTRRIQSEGVLLEYTKRVDLVISRSQGQQASVLWRQESITKNPKNNG